MRLHSFLKPLFWEHRFASLDWPGDRDLVIRRILTAGDERALSWLRRREGNEGLRDWLLQNRGGGLDPRRLRFWQLLLDLPPRTVTPWIDRARTGEWERRTAR